MNSLIEFLENIGKSDLIAGLASICGIIGLTLTIVVTIKTASISKILKQNTVISQYNKERVAFQRNFEGHRQTIIVEDIESDKLLKDILADVESYSAKFSNILPVKDKVTIFLFKRILRKRSKDVNYNAVCNYLAAISGRLTKKEDTKHG